MNSKVKYFLKKFHCVFAMFGQNTNACPTSCNVGITFCKKYSKSKYYNSDKKVICTFTFECQHLEIESGASNPVSSSGRFIFFFLKKTLEDINPFCGVPVLDF